MRLKRLLPKVGFDLWVFGVIKHKLARDLFVIYYCFGPFSWRRYVSR